MERHEIYAEFYYVTDTRELDSLAPGLGIDIPLVPNIME